MSDYEKSHGTANAKAAPPEIAMPAAPTVVAGASEEPVTQPEDANADESQSPVKTTVRRPAAKPVAQPTAANNGNDNAPVATSVVAGKNVKPTANVAPPKSSFTQGAAQATGSASAGSGSGSTAKTTAPSAASDNYAMISTLGEFACENEHAFRQLIAMLSKKQPSVPPLCWLSSPPARELGKQTTCIAIPATRRDGRRDTIDNNYKHVCVQRMED